MQPQQITTPQKTSFWDFRHKKIYVSKEEKLIDFVTGTLGAFILFSVLIIIWALIHDSNFFYRLYDKIFDCITCIDSAQLLSVLLPYFLLLIFLALKRKYMFFGALLGTFPLLALLILIALLSSGSWV